MNFASLMFSSYTDHNMITLNLNLIFTRSTEKARIDRKKMEMFQEKTENTKLVELRNKADRMNIFKKHTHHAVMKFSI